MTPFLVAPWKAEMNESLDSFKYWTPLVASTRMFGPSLFGPKVQILKASSFSHPYYSQSTLALPLTSSVAVT